MNNSELQSRWDDLQDCIVYAIRTNMFMIEDYNAAIESGTSSSEEVIAYTVSRNFCIQENVMLRKWLDMDHRKKVDA